MLRSNIIYGFRYIYTHMFSFHECACCVEKRKLREGLSFDLVWIFWIFKETWEGTWHNQLSVATQHFCIEIKWFVTACAFIYLLVMLIVPFWFFVLFTLICYKWWKMGFECAYWGLDSKCGGENVCVNCK